MKKDNKEGSIEDANFNERNKNKKNEGSKEKDK